MRILLIFILFLTASVFYAQCTYSELLEKGEGEVTIGYHNFSKEGKGANEKGFEYEILTLFLDYVEEQKGVRINRRFAHAASFKSLYQDVALSSVDFAYCFFSITDERKQEVQFSPSYMPNIEVLISNNNLPIVSDSNDFRKRFKGATGLYIPETTYEDNIKSIQNSFSEINLESIESSTKLINKINTTPNYFGFIELQQYFNSQKELTNVSRQNLFITKREGYGFIFPLESGWKPIVDLFFIERKKEIDNIIKERFDSEMIEFINSIRDTKSGDLNLMLLTKEKELQKLKSITNKLLYDNEKLENLKSKSQKKELQRNLLLVILLFAVVIIISIVAYRLKVKHNNEVILKNKQLAIQKGIVELKHKEIKDSINYAKRIQNALLQGEEHHNPLLPEHFIYFQPRDVVSGDFYWGKTFEKHFYLSVTDCTGHGVPGGFMSVLGIAMLNEIARSKKNIKPNDMLNILREKLIVELDQNERRDSNKDGMNTVVVKVNSETLFMDYAGAYHSLLIIRNGELMELKTDKQPIGFTYIMNAFNNYSFQLEKGDMIYLFTDGFSDQFGGERGKKYMSRNFKALLVSIHTKPLTEQKIILNNAFNTWKGKEEQVDDVTVWGMRI